MKIKNVLGKVLKRGNKDNNEILAVFKQKALKIYDKYKTGLAFGAVLVILMMMMIELNVSTFGKSDLVAAQLQKPFNGLANPLNKIPDWVALTTSEWKLSFDQIPENKLIDFPEYIPSELVMDHKLISDSREQKRIRNAQVTFSVPYMGNYKLDGREYAGSHLAVDIKAPIGTPVYAIGNGVVIKTSLQNSGFGHHVVIKHYGFPSMEDENVKTNYISSYSHLSSILVTEGQIVEKGQLIGKVGQTGAATTPHLHFQIDKESAPWHPYWPFTYQEAVEAGFNFSTAVNAGLGKEKALQNTINPFVYIAKYRSGKANEVKIDKNIFSFTEGLIDNNNGNNSIVSEKEKVEVKIPIQDELPPIIELTTLIVENKENTVLKDGEFGIKEGNTVIEKKNEEIYSIRVETMDNFVVGEKSEIKIKLLDKDENLLTNLPSGLEIYVRVENGSAELERSYLRASDFKDGIGKLNFVPKSDYGLRFSVTDGKIIGVSKVLQSSLFKDVKSDADNYVAIAFLKQNGVVKGYEDGSFRPNSTISRVEALKMIYEALNKNYVNVSILPFEDTDVKAWYARYIGAALKEGIVKGYSPRIFRPANNVTRAEFLKMILHAAEFTNGSFPEYKKPFADVNSVDWFYGYVAFAKDRKIISNFLENFRPNDAISRAEAAEIAYRVAIMKIAETDVYRTGLMASLDKIETFYNRN